MRFGFFDQLPCADADSERQRYQDLIAQIELGDALGFDTVWLREPQFSRPLSILAQPLMVLAAPPPRTPTGRPGAGGTPFPLHRPVQVPRDTALARLLRHPP